MFIKSICSTWERACDTGREAGCKLTTQHLFLPLSLLFRLAHGACSTWLQQKAESLTEYMYINPCATRANKTLHSTAKTTLPPPRVSQSTHSHKAQFLPTPPSPPPPQTPCHVYPSKIYCYPSNFTLPGLSNFFTHSPFAVFFLFSLSPLLPSFPFLPGFRRSAAMEKTKHDSSVNRLSITGWLRPVNLLRWGLKKQISSRTELTRAREKGRGGRSVRSGGGWGGNLSSQAWQQRRHTRHGGYGGGGCWTALFVVSWPTMLFFYHSDARAGRWDTF